MSSQQPRYSAEETARRGDEIYEREVRARVEAGITVKFLLSISRPGHMTSTRTPSPRSASAPGAECRNLVRAGRPPRSWTGHVGKRQRGTVQYVLFDHCGYPVWWINRYERRCVEE
jgi:hypothetical protein